MIKKARKHHFHLSPARYLAIGVVVAILSLGGWALKSKNDQKTNDNSPTAADSTYVNLNPPTEQELKETEEHKKSLESENSQSSGYNGDKKQVTPVITSADAQQVNAFVSGVFEEGGTCTATFTKGSELIRATSTGFQNVSYTNCAPIDISGSLSTGDWTVVVSYQSTTAEGKSQPKEFRIK